LRTRFVVVAFVLSLLALSACSEAVMVSDAAPSAPFQPSAPSAQQMAAWSQEAAAELQALNLAVWYHQAEINTAVERWNAVVTFNAAVEAQAQAAAQAAAARAAAAARVRPAPARVSTPVRSGSVRTAPVAGTGRCGGNLPPCGVMTCESGGSLTAVNGTNPARPAGKWQIIGPTWNGYGGYATADQAPEAVQDAKAEQLYAGGAGRSQWSC
jgi:hypothetical protein